jgi:trigger factor
MNVTETSAEGLKREFRIVVPASEVEEHVTRRLGEIGRSVRIPGFRPGKVPLPLLRKRFGPAVRGEVLESAVQDSSAEAMRERNVRPALPPRVEIVSAVEGADLEYKMSIELMPEMPEPDWSGLGLERLVAQVPDEDIDRAVERIAESQRKAEPVARAAVSGDILIADTVGRVDDVEIPGSRAEGREIELGSESLLPGFSDQLLGAAAGDKREVRVTFPEDYGAADFAGKEGVFDITVNEVRERQPAVIDDTLAEAVGLENLAELRQEIRQRMERDYAGIARQRLKRTLLDKLAERYDFAVPPGMIEVEFRAIWQQYEAEKEQRRQIAAARAAATAPTASPEGPVDAGALIAPEETALEGASERAPAGAEAARPAVPATARAAAAHEVPLVDEPAGAPLDAAALVAPEETALEGAADAEPAVPLDADDEKARTDFQRIAERRVRLGLLLAEVGRNNNITVTQEELNQALTQEARRHPGYERQVIDYYRKNPEAFSNLRAPIFEEKVVDFIVELAKPTDRTVAPQELMTGEDTDGDGAAAAAAPSGQ